MRGGIDGQPDLASQDPGHDHDQIAPASKASSTTSSIRGRVTSTSDKKPRRPPASRRNSTHPNTVSKFRPEFSVDDNQSEVEEDLNTQRIRGTIPGSTSYSQMRRHSLLRKRPTVGGPADDEEMERPEIGEEDELGEGEGGEGSGDESYEPSEADSVESFTLKVGSPVKVIEPITNIKPFLGPATSNQRDTPIRYSYLETCTV